MPCEPALSWHRLDARQANIEALVVLFCDPLTVETSKALATRWSGLVPRSACVRLVDLWTRRSPVTAYERRIGAEARRLGLATSQITMIGWGALARTALDVALGNALPGVHAIFVDLPGHAVLLPSPPPRGAFRFVQHRPADDPEGRHFDRTIQQLRAARLDIRTIVLPESTDATNRAIDTFLIELVARASRQPSSVSAGTGEPPLSEQRA